MDFEIPFLVPCSIFAVQKLAIFECSMFFVGSMQNVVQGLWDVCGGRMQCCFVLFEGALGCLAILVSFAENSVQGQ